MLLMYSKDLPFMASHSYIFVFSLSQRSGLAIHCTFTLIMVPKNFEQLPFKADIENYGKRSSTSVI